MLAIATTNLNSLNNTSTCNNTQLFAIVASESLRRCAVCNSG
nr:MAG TPA: hypothetical protein [Caudoviricetes sp.]